LFHFSSFLKKKQTSDLGWPVTESRDWDPVPTEQLAEKRKEEDERGVHGHNACSAALPQPFFATTFFFFFFFC
jgi:hypothetical protein